MFSFSAKYVCSIVASRIVCTTNARNGWRFPSTTTDGWDGDASNATLWHAIHGFILISGLLNIKEKTHTLCSYSGFLVKPFAFSAEYSHLLSVRTSFVGLVVLS